MGFPSDQPVVSLSVPEAANRLGQAEGNRSRGIELLGSIRTPCGHIHAAREDGVDGRFVCLIGGYYAINPDDRLGDSSGDWNGGRSNKTRGVHHAEATVVNAGEKVHRRAGVKMHQG